MRSKFRIEFSENKAVAEAFSRAEPGDEIELEATVQVSNVTEKYAEGDVVEVRLPEEEVTETGSVEGKTTGGTILPESASPVGINILPPSVPPRVAEG